MQTVNSKQVQILEISSNKKLSNTQKSFLPKIHNVSRHENEKWEIKALPSDWKTAHSSSTCLQSLAKKREMEHNKCLMHLQNEILNINTKIENKIRLKSQTIKEEYQNIQIKSEMKIKEKLEKDPLFLGKLKLDDFDGLLNNIQRLYENYLDKVKEFYAYLLQLERTRCYQFKIILRDAFVTLHNIAFKLPKDLQEIFEHKILYYNQITLSNLRCYLDICSTLQLQGENSLRRWVQTINFLKDKWKTTEKEQTTQRLIEFRKVSTSGLLQKEVSRSVNIQFDIKEKRDTFSSTLSQTMLVPLQAQHVNNWCTAVEAEIKELGYTTRTLVNLYRGAIVQVFNGYMEEFQNIAERMVNTGITDDIELEQFNREIAVPIIDEISTHLSSKISDIKQAWEELSSNLEKQTTSTLSFLRSAALIWDRHFKRLGILQSTILKELDQVIVTNNKFSEKKEVNICILIDKMRQQSNKTDLDKELDNLNKLLDELQEAYIDDCRKELAVINKYPELAQDDTELLMKELRQFLNAYPKKIKEIRRASRCTIQEESELVLPAQMKLCEYEVQALDNWILGLWEAIDKYLLTCNTELASKAEQWKDTHVKRILKRLEVKIAFHKARYSRTRINIYDTRLCELEAHSERFERHKMEIGIQMQEMSTVTATYGNKLHIMLEKECTDLETRIVKKVETTKSSLVVNTIAHELGVAARKLESRAKDVINEFNDIIQAKRDKIFESNHMYRKSIKFFSEDGNFGQKEAKFYFKELKKLEATLEKNINILQIDIDPKYQKLKIIIHEKHSHLKLMLKLYKEELEFRELVIKEIRKVQSEVKICIYDKKYTLKRFSAEIKRLKHPVFSKLENFSRFKTNFNDLVTRIVGFEMYLMRQEVNSDVFSANSSRNISPTRRRSLTAKSSRTSKSSSKPSTSRSKMSSTASSTGTDYTIYVFPIRPSDTCTFMMELYNALFNSMDIIQRMAKKFYRKDRTVRNTEILQPTLAVFMDEIVNKYKRYTQHVETAWMEIVNETLKLLKHLLHFIWKQYEVILQNFYDTEIKESNKQQKLFEIEKTKEQYEHLNKNLHERLKVHYAYENNRLLLDFLLEETEKVKHNLKIDNIYNWMRDYEDMQNTEKIDFINRLNYLENELQTLKNVGFNIVNTKLIKQFEENLVPKNKSASSTKKDGGSLSWSTISEVSVKYENFKSQSKMLSENKSTLTPKLTIVSSTSFLPPSLPKNSIMDLNEEIIYEETITKDKLIKEFEKELYKRREAMHDVKRSFDLVLDKWEKIFTTSKEKILKLYTVKYDNL